MDDRDQLNAWFGRYREALPDPEPSAGFTPGLWARIEARRRESQRFVVVARRMLAAASTLGLALGLLVMSPESGERTQPTLTASYVEMLAEVEGTGAYGK